MINRLLILVLLATTIGCYEPVDLDLPVHEEKLVFFANLTPDGPINATLTKTRGLGSQPLSPADEFISDATIGISSEGVLLHKLIYISPMESGDLEPAYKNPNFTTQIGRPYEISIEAPGFDPVIASCIIPAPAKVGHVKINSPIEVPMHDSLPSSYRRGTIVGSLIIDDDPNTNNYYHLATAEMYYDWVDPFSGDTTFNYEILYDLPLENIKQEESAFVSLPSGSGFLIDESRLAPGTRIPFRVSYLFKKGTNHYNNLRLNLRHCDKAYFDFHYAWARQQENNSPFDQAVPSKTNISDGLGYFSGYSTSQAEFIFPPK